MTQESTSHHSFGQPRTAEQLEKGEIVHIADIDRGDGKKILAIDENGNKTNNFILNPQTIAVRAFLEEQNATYGAENVVSGLPLDPETGVPTRDPKRLGVYVTTEAFQAAQNAVHGQPRLELVPALVVDRPAQQEHNLVA